MIKTYVNDEMQALDVKLFACNDFVEDVLLATVAVGWLLLLINLRRRRSDAKSTHQAVVRRQRDTVKLGQACQCASKGSLTGWGLCAVVMAAQAPRAKARPCHVAFVLMQCQVDAHSVL